MAASSSTRSATRHSSPRRRQTLLGDLAQAGPHLVRRPDDHATPALLFGAQHGDQVLEGAQVLVVFEISGEQQVDESADLVGVLYREERHGGTKLGEVRARQNRQGALGLLGQRAVELLGGDARPSLG